MDALFAQVIEFFSRHYEHPDDIDVLFANMDQRFHPGANLPKMVAQLTCLEMKRLKCTDRFFYTWNPNLGEGSNTTCFTLAQMMGFFVIVSYDITLQTF